jgi:cholinesterase
MSNALSIPLLNYAFGGAESGTRGLLPARAAQVGMLKQISDFLANQPSSTTPVDAQALYVLWTGPDDFYVDGNIFNKATVNTVTANVKTGMTTLYKRGARQFFVPMMPDLSITPSAIKDKVIKGYFANSKLRSAELATSMTAMLKAFAKQYPSAQIRTFDTYTYSQTRRAQATSEGMNVTEPCYTPTVMGLPGPVCANPEAYLFWDTQHPTAAASRVIGSDFAKAAVGAALPSR